MPWNASTSRPTPATHTSTPASAAETPSAVVARRAAAVFCTSQIEPMTNAIIATAPYSSVVITTAASWPPKSTLVTKR